MSQPEHQRQRSNFYSSAGGDYEPDREPLDDSKPTHQRATSSSSNKDEWIAFGILRRGRVGTDLVAVWKVDLRGVATDDYLVDVVGYRTVAETDTTFLPVGHDGTVEVDFSGAPYVEVARIIDHGDHPRRRR